MKFRHALNALEDGYKVARKGWNGKGMWLMLVKAAEPKGSEYEALMSFPTYRVSNIHEDDLLPWIGMKTADGKFVPWLASQTDMLASDWETLK